MRKMTRQGIRPTFRLVFDQSGEPGGFHRVFPFRRHWIAIAAVAVFDAVFLFPAVTTFQQAVAEWSRLDSLFDLTGALFLTFWLMGWSIAPLALTTVLVLLLFGREVMRSQPGGVELIIGLPMIGFASLYDVTSMRNLRLETPERSSGTAWRNSHGVFDYGANSVGFGTQMDAADLAAIRSGIQLATGHPVRKGDATEEELTGEWAPNRIIPRSVDSTARDVAPASSSASGSRLSLASPSTLLLIAANLVPIFGASFLGWRLSDVMVLYWAESAVVGFYNILKMVIVGRWFALLGVPFFIGHFGAFMAIHFLFLYSLFVQGPTNLSAADLTEVGQLFLDLSPGLVALFLSHGFSFFHNFLGQREYRNRTVNTQMSEPYQRIVFMHLVLIFGGGITLFLGEPTPVLLLVIALKIGFDVRGHLRQHYA